jgi:hypothetical protein
MLAKRPHGPFQGYLGPSSVDLVLVMPRENELIVLDWVGAEIDSRGIARLVGTLD